MGLYGNENSTNQLHVPSVYGAVTASTNFTHNGTTYIARCIWASADGTIDVIREDGTTMADKKVFAGMNLFTCRQVTDLNGLTLEWGA